MEKVISFTGIEKGDFVYYLALILSSQNKAVLVIDNSYSKDVFNAVSDFTQMDFVIKQNITYLKDTLFNRDCCEEFDYAIIWQGMNISEDVLMYSDISYIMPNYEPSCLYLLNQKIKNKTLINNVIMRDATTANKLSIKTISTIFEVNEEAIVSEIIHDIKDYESYLAFSYNGRQRINGLSPNYMASLEYVTQQVLDVDNKTIKKIMRKVKDIK